MSFLLGETGFQELEIRRVARENGIEHEAKNHHACQHMIGRIESKVFQ